MPLTVALTSAFAAVRRHAGKILLATAAVAAAAMAGPRVIQGPEIAVATVVQRNFVQSVVASGRVETPHRIDVGVQITGSVVRIPVTEGQFVAAGTTLIELESAELRATLRQAELAIRQAEARMRQINEVQAPVAEQSLRQAQAILEVARRALARSRELFGKGFIGQAALDDAQRAEQVAEAQFHTAQQQLAGARPAGSDTAVAEAALAQARAAAEAAQARLRYATVKAPAAGTLIARNVERGDVVQPGKVLMVLSPAGETQLVLQIDEKNLRLLRLGLPALGSADAYPQQRFPAELVYINPGIDAQRGSVEVKLRVPSAPDYLKQDMTVSVDIEVARRDQAVLVPGDALRDADTAAPWVLKVEDGHARRQTVKPGLRSNGLAEVLEGLRAGELVIPTTAAGAGVLADGARVRPLAATAP